MRLGGYAVKIHNIDHPPPHCHAEVNGKDVKVDLATFEILNPPPHHLPAKLRRNLAGRRESLHRAWERVIIIPPGSDPTW